MQQKIEIVVQSFEAEYAECGTHRLKLTVLIDNSELKDLAENIAEKLEQIEDENE